MQDPKNLTDIRCDVKACGKRIKPKDRFLRLDIYTVYAGETGFGVMICKDCAISVLGLTQEAFDAR